MQSSAPLSRLPSLYLWIALAAAACLMGCAGSDASVHPGSGDGPAVRRLWQVAVAESDTFYVGRPAALTVDALDGSFYVTDRFFGRVVRVDRRGHPVQTYGRKGRGPGELTDAGLAFHWGGQVMVADVPRRHLAVFDRESATFRENRSIGGILYDAVPEPDGVWLGMQNATRRTGAARWSPRDGGMRHFAAFPPEYEQSQPLAGIFTAVHVDRWADTVAVGFQGSNHIVLHQDQRGPVDTLFVPAVRRRGVPPDIVERLERVQFPEMFRSASFLFDLQRVADGRLALIHYDQEIDGRAITAVPYLSVSSPDRRSWCVDGELPFSRDAQPHTAFRGDTLFVLDQALDGETAATRITAFALDLSECTWTPAPRRRP